MWFCLFLHQAPAIQEFILMDFAFWLNTFWKDALWPLFWPGAAELVAYSFPLFPRFLQRFIARSALRLLTGIFLLVAGFLLRTEDPVNCILSSSEKKVLFAKIVLLLPALACPQLILASHLQTHLSPACLFWTSVILSPIAYEILTFLVLSIQQVCFEKIMLLRFWLISS